MARYGVCRIVANIVTIQQTHSFPVAALASVSPTLQTPFANRGLTQFGPTSNTPPRDATFTTSNGQKSLVPDRGIHAHTADKLFVYPGSSRQSWAPDPLTMPDSEHPMSIVSTRYRRDLGLDWPDQPGPRELAGCGGIRGPRGVRLRPRRWGAHGSGVPEHQCGCGPNDFTHTVPRYLLRLVSERLWPRRRRR